MAQGRKSAYSQGKGGREATVIHILVSVVGEGVVTFLWWGLKAVRHVTIKER